MKWPIRFLTVAVFCGEALGVWWLLQSTPPELHNLVSNLIPLLGVPTLLVGFLIADRN
jgi:hypothetical protein